jgi:glucuronate isomerase
MTTFDDLYAVAKNLPIIDWHNHLDMRMLAEDKPLGSLYEVWVKADPYKHRAMRICGEPERLITGDAPEAEKWVAWRRTLPKLVGNPLFAWARMEMDWLGIDFNTEAQRHREGSAFGDLENVSLSEWTPSKLLLKFNVEYCDPGYRMDAGAVADFAEMERVHARGGRVLDISADDVNNLQSSISNLQSVAAFAAAHGWTMLLHMGALRETSARLRAAAGPAGGFAGMRGPLDPVVVARFLDRLESVGALPRTILLTLNPEAHAQLAVLAGSFVEEGVPGKVQLGPAWWWCDHAEAIRDVFEKQAAYGVLSTFVGMTTDSRSLLSFVRHDYFRRLFCRWLADKVATGEFPDDPSLLLPIVENVCYRNARAMVGDGIAK